MIDVKKMCKEKGLRMTEQRNIIADVITEMSTNGHPDVNEIFLNANDKDKNSEKIAQLKELFKTSSTVTNCRILNTGFDEFSQLQCNLIPFNNIILRDRNIIFINKNVLNKWKLKQFGSKR